MRVHAKWTSSKQGGHVELQALHAAALAGLKDREDLVDWFDHRTRASEAARIGRAASARVGAEA